MTQTKLERDIAQIKQSVIAISISSLITSLGVLYVVFKAFI